MNKLETFEQFLTTKKAYVSVVRLIFNLFLSAIFAFILGRLYIRYARVLSNRKAFAENFIMLTMTTMLIIMIVKSSLALSLGLVGALSIVRFRTAIKEPEELAYVFLCIAIGLGLGADQLLATLVAFVVICIVLIFRSRFRKIDDNQNLFLTVTSSSPGKLSLDQINKTIKKYCQAVDMKRFDETKDILEASFIVEFSDFEKLSTAKRKLQELNEDIKIVFLDNTGLI
jgi:hypothetical protein